MDPLSSAEVVRDRLPETLAQMWERWMTIICMLDYGYWYDLATQTCRGGGMSG